DTRERADGGDRRSRRHLRRGQARPLHGLPVPSGAGARGAPARARVGQLRADSPARGGQRRRAAHHARLGLQDHARSAPGRRHAALAGAVHELPSNPCGVMYTPDELRALAAAVEDAARATAPGLVIVTDEIYEKIVYGGVPHVSIGSFPAVAQRTVTVNGLSK